MMIVTRTLLLLLLASSASAYLRDRPGADQEETDLPDLNLMSDCGEQRHSPSDTLELFTMILFAPFQPVFLHFSTSAATHFLRIGSIVSTSDGDTFDEADPETLDYNHFVSDEAVDALDEVDTARDMEINEVDGASVGKQELPSIWDILPLTFLTSIPPMGLPPPSQAAGRLRTRPHVIVVSTTH
jgi:hypothetical protein